MKKTSLLLGFQVSKFRGIKKQKTGNKTENNDHREINLNLFTYIDIKKIIKNKNRFKMVM